MQCFEIRDPRWLITFPNPIAPQEDEWLPGLLLRCDEANGWFSGTTATYIARLTTGPQTLGRPALFVVASFFELPLLAERLAVTPEEIFATTFVSPLLRLYTPAAPNTAQLGPAQEARYARIQACIGKPSEITRERALRELRLAFISDMRAIIGSPEMLYEPHLGEDGQVQARPRGEPLPEEPLTALEALTDHLLATQQEAQHAPLQPGPQGGTRTPFGQRTGWEQRLTDWLADMGERFGYDANWLLQELHLRVLQEQGLGQGWSTRERDAFQRQGGYAFHALWLWNVPDVELRAWLRRQVQAQPEQGEWLWKALMLLGFTSAPQPGKPLHTLPKSVLLALFSRYPSPRDLYLALRDRQGAPPQESTPVQPSPAAAPPSPPATSAREVPAPAPQEPPPAVRDEQSQLSNVFTVVSPTFGQQLPRPATPVGLSAAPPPARPAARSASVPPSEPLRPDPSVAYQPVHAACVTLLQAIERLSAQYGRVWMQWEQAQADLAHLRAILVPGDEISNR